MVSPNPFTFPVSYLTGAQGEFSAWLDPSLMLAIINERDVVKEHSDIRGLLSKLAESARAEQATGFDPSGLGCLAENEVGQTSDGFTTSGGNCLSTENATTVSEFSDSESPLFTHRSDLTEDDKIGGLLEIFPFVKKHTIRFLLKNCDGVIERAYDELLNRQYLTESGDLPKGIDGFYMPDDSTPRDLPKLKTANSRTKNGKGKKKLDISYSVVSPTIDDGELEGASGPPQPPKVSRLPSGNGHVSYSSVSSPEAWSSTRTVATPRVALPDLGGSRSHIRSAAAMSRLGPLGRQGASVYIQRAREEARKALEKTAVMAEQLVNQQSCETRIDLHGVTVLDGVRIAKHRAWQWWDNLGESRERIAKQQGFTVITGVGHHSQNGVSRLRQAVGIALQNDGWKVEALTGQFYITGRAS